MPVQRNDFVPQNILTVYDSPSGMRDLRTTLPYQAGGLMVGNAHDLTEAEAQAASNGQCHTGRYRFVQIDSAATATAIVRGSIGLMRALALGVNVITDYAHGLAGCHPVVFLAPVTAAQVTAGAYVFVQEAGDATVLTPAVGVTNGGAVVGDLANSVAGGFVDDPAAPAAVVATTIGRFSNVPSNAVQGLYRVMLDLPIVQG